MKKFLYAMSIATAFASGNLAFRASADVPSGYYDSLEGLSGVELKLAVKALVADHTVIDYGDVDPTNTFHPVEVASWSVFSESDVRDINGVSCWWDMYSANNMRVQDGHPGLNIEHSVANSWWGGSKDTKGYSAYRDLHHLNPSNGDANGQKSNLPLGEIQGSPYWTNGVTTTGTPKTGLGDGSTRVFEPYASYKGDFARAYFYIFTLYDDINWQDQYGWMFNAASPLTLKPWAYELLLQWSEADPVSLKELGRNDVIYSYQGNRNPFIDCPELAAHIWGDRQDQPFHYALYTPGDDDPAQYPGWDEEPVEMNTGQWVPVTSVSEVREGTDYFIVAAPTAKRSSYRLMSHNLVANGNAIDECLYSPLLELVTYPAAFTAVPQDIATVRFEKADGGWYAGVYDPEGGFKGYISVSTKNSAKFSATKNENCRVTIDFNADKTAVVTFAYNTGDGKPFTLQYNSGNPRFAAYSSTQNAIQLYKPSDVLLEDPREEDPSQAGVGSTGFENAEPEIICIYDINGRRVNATSTADLERGIYIIVTNFGTKKIRK